MTKETYDLLETTVQNQLEWVGTLRPGDEGAQEVVKNAAAITQLLIAVDKDDAEYNDKDERREIEKLRNESVERIELEKQKLTWKRVGFELAKALLPLGVSVWAYDRFQKRMFKFEETGRVCSSAGRQLSLPKFFK